MGSSEYLIRDISGEGEPDTMSVESLCVRCENQGVTRFFVTRIPYFKEIILSSFTCDYCGESNNEVQPAATIKDKAVKYTVNISSPEDLNRQIVISSSASVFIPEIDFEIPANKSYLTTVEGILVKAMDDLSRGQALRTIQNPEMAKKMELFLESLNQLKSGDKPFTLIVDDISGNSFVENLVAPETDPKLTETHYWRNITQDEALCIYADTTSEQDEDVTNKANTNQESGSLKDEVMQLDGNCPACQAPCPINMKVVDIPHFKEIVIMATTCDNCGYRNNEVKSATGVSEKGCRIRLCIQSQEDLKRDLLKSETGYVRIPELEFETHSLGGKFTTVEGILVDIKDNLIKVDPFALGDSTTGAKKARFDDFLTNVQQIINGDKFGLHLELDDPAGNCFIQNLHAPDCDPLLRVEFYERSFEQNEELGLNDMKTEDYELN